METLLLSLIVREDHDEGGHCTKDTCSVDKSLYGYLPSQVGNIIFVALFVISCAIHLFHGIKSRAWTFTIALGVGTILEAVGYVGRLMLRNDPFSRGAIGIQLVSLTVAPAFIAAGIYLTLKHLIIIHGSKFSRIAPRWYTWIFVGCDIVSILLQMAGAVLAIDNGTIGTIIMMIGIVFQVVTLVAFGAMALDVFLRVRKAPGEFPESTNMIRSSRRFKGLLGAIVVAYATIFIRCVYRIAEMAGGWQNPIMQDQIAFIVLDGVMCVIATFAFNAFHPGFLFKQSYIAIKMERATSEEVEFDARYPIHSAEN